MRPSPKTAIEAAPIPFWALFESEVSKIAAKSLVLEDFTRNLFKLKELAGISP